MVRSRLAVVAAIALALAAAIPARGAAPTPQASQDLTRYPFGLVTSANEGNPAAQYCLGKFLEAQGNRRAAAGWYMAAAYKGQARARAAMARVYAPVLGAVRGPGAPTPPVIDPDEDCVAMIRAGQRGQRPPAAKPSAKPSGPRPPSARPSAAPSQAAGSAPADVVRAFYRDLNDARANNGRLPVRWLTPTFAQVVSATSLADRQEGYSTVDRIDVQVGATSIKGRTATVRYQATLNGPNVPAASRRLDAVAHLEQRPGSTEWLITDVVVGGRSERGGAL